MRLLGLDYGAKTVGIAMSDPLGITAQGYETVWRKSENKLRKTLARIQEIVEEYQIEGIVLGLPKNMNASLGERAERTLEFRDLLEARTGMEIILWDERLTTAEAERLLMAGGVRRENRKEVIDQMAAALILQSYLDCHRVGGC